MKKEEKNQIYNLLKICDNYINGYTRNKFCSQVEFFDDIPKSEQNIQNESFANENLLNQINNKILRCTNCGLARTRNNVLFGKGVENPKVLVIGEMPSFDEDLQGTNLVGKSGILLEKMLKAINLDVNSNCYVTNIIKCRPPENRNAYPDELSACFPFLESQIRALKPKAILCMGKNAIEKLLNQNISLAQNHGVFFDFKGIFVMSTYSPNDLLLDESLKRPAWEDLKLFIKKLNLR